MPELFLSGPDAFGLIEQISINSMANLTLDRAKQMVGCTPEGYVIGDCVLYRHAEDDFELVSGMPLLNWVHFQAEAQGLDVTIEREVPTPFSQTGRRRKYRYQLDGPTAGAVLDDAVDGDAPVIEFFRTASVIIEGREVLALRHGMAGHQGVELSGPWEDRDVVLDALLRAGRSHGLRRGGTIAYFSTAFESGWLTQPCPGIFTADSLRDYREWLPASGWEGNQHLAGSFRSSSIEDYYATPWDLGYGRMMKFDHDFIGRPALEAMQDAPHRKKVTLIWDNDDAAKLLTSQLGDGPRYKAFEMPLASYGFPQADAVRTPSGDLIGVSSITAYSYNDRIMGSLAMVDEAHAEVGSEVVVTWGEPDGGSRKPEVERHEQLDIRATIAPAPYAAAVRESKVAAIAAPH